MRADREVLLQDPYHPYAVGMLRWLAEDHGLRAVCFYTDDVERKRQMHKYGELRGPLVSASYRVDLDDLDAFVDELRCAHRIVAVAPHSEPAVLPASRLARRLGLDWAEPDVIGLFRDKHALKVRLRSVDGGPRVNLVSRVASVADVRAAVESGSLDRFVLKPNDGYGNVEVAFFDARTDDAALSGYLEAAGRPVLLEEYVDGTEYCVDGQTDAEGRVQVVAVWRYDRAEAADGRQGLKLGDRTVPTSDPDFALLADYATAVLRATGLTRSPFHLEAKVDGRGPCLIEVAARLVGTHHAELETEAHGSLDVLRVAAHHYATGSGPAPGAPDWARYDASGIAFVNGLSSGSGTLYELGGIADAEAMPEFLRWIQSPAVGQRLTPTVDLLTHPWRAAVRLGPGADLREVGDRMRSTVRLNGESTGALRAIRRVLALQPRVRGRVKGILRRPVHLLDVPHPR